jgi:hypothetical protein
MKLNGSPVLLPDDSWRIKQRNDLSEDLLPFDLAWSPLSFAVNETIDTDGVETIDPVQKSLLVDIAKHGDVSTVHSTEVPKWHECGGPLAYRECSAWQSLAQRDWHFRNWEL